MRRQKARRKMKDVPQKFCRKITLCLQKACREIRLCLQNHIVIIALDMMYGAVIAFGCGLFCSVTILSQLYTLSSLSANPSK